MFTNRKIENRGHGYCKLPCGYGIDNACFWNESEETT